MSKEIDKLIEQMLSEKIGLSGLTTTAGGKYKAAGIKDIADYDSVKAHRKKKDVDALAKLDGSGASISPKDIEVGREDPGHEDYANAWLDGIVGGPHSSNNSFFLLDYDFSLASKAKGLHKVGQGPTNFAAVAWDYLTAGEAAKAEAVLEDFQSLTDAKAANFSYVSTDLVANVRQAIAGDQTDRGDEIKTALQSLIKASNASIEREKREYTDLAGPLDIATPEAEISGLGSTATSFGTKVPEIDSALKSQMDVFDLSQGVQGIFTQIAEVARQIQEDDFPSSPDDAFEFIIKANVVTRIANLSKMYDYSSAGFEFEKLLALVLGGAKVGGDAGAADVLAQLNGSDAIHTSQKLVTEDHSYQSLKNTIDLLKKDKKLFYTFLRKTGGSSGDVKTGYDGIEVYISSIYTKDTVDPTIGNIFIADAIPNQGFSAARKVTQGTGENATKIKIKPKHLFATIPLIPTNIPQKVASYVSGQITGGTQTPFKQMAAKILDSFKILKNIERNTQEYNAERAKSGSGIAALNPTAYVSQIASDYVDLKTTYEGIFKPAEKTGATKVAGQQVFTESKSTLDQLIEAIVKGMTNETK